MEGEKPPKIPSQGQTRPRGRSFSAWEMCESRQELEARQQLSTDGRVLALAQRVEVLERRLDEENRVWKFGEDLGRRAIEAVKGLKSISEGHLERYPGIRNGLKSGASVGLITLAYVSLMSPENIHWWQEHQGEFLTLLTATTSVSAIAGGFIEKRLGVPLRLF